MTASRRMMEMEERVLNNRYISSVVFPIGAMPGPGPQRGTPTHPYVDSSFFRFLEKLY
jgi:hypothetical protein